MPSGFCSTVIAFIRPGIVLAHAFIVAAILIGSTVCRVFVCVVIFVFQMFVK